MAITVLYLLPRFVYFLLVLVFISLSLSLSVYKVSSIHAIVVSTPPFSLPSPVTRRCCLFIDSSAALFCSVLLCSALFCSAKPFDIAVGEARNMETLR